LNFPSLRPSVPFLVHVIDQNSSNPRNFIDFMDYDASGASALSDTLFFGPFLSSILGRFRLLSWLFIDQF
jgi:hypothetical protein